MTYSEYAETQYDELESGNEQRVLALAAGGVPMHAMEFLAVQIRLSALTEELVSQCSIDSAKFDLRYEASLRVALDTLAGQVQQFAASAPNGAQSARPQAHIEVPKASGLILPGRG